MKTTPSPSDTHAQVTNIFPHDTAWESDAVLNLLRTGSVIQASDDFVDRVIAKVRTAKPQSPSLWSQCRRFILPAMAAAACLVAAIVSSLSPRQDKTTVVDAAVEVPATEIFADLQEATNREVLLAVADHLNDFSDTELVTLIGL
jgi:hypothetical protein